eukprot:1142830-Pelagomonas_calceolata.AAC.3
MQSRGRISQSDGVLMSPRVENKKSVTSASAALPTVGLHSEFLHSLGQIGSLQKWCSHRHGARLCAAHAHSGARSCSSSAPHAAFSLSGWLPPRHGAEAACCVRVPNYKQQQALLVLRALNLVPGFHDD